MLMIKLTTHCMKNFEHASRSIPQYKTIPGRRKAQPRKWGKCWCFNAVTQIAIPHWIDDDQNGDDDDDDDDDDFRDLGEIWELRGNCRCVSKPRQPRYSKIIIRIIIFIRIIRIIIFIISVSSLWLPSIFPPVRFPPGGNLTSWWRVGIWHSQIPTIHIYKYVNAWGTTWSAQSKCKQCKWKCKHCNVLSKARLKFSMLTS